MDQQHIRAIAIEAAAAIESKWSNPQHTQVLSWADVYTDYILSGAKPRPLVAVSASPSASGIESEDPQQATPRPDRTGKG